MFAPGKCDSMAKSLSERAIAKLSWRSRVNETRDRSGIAFPRARAPRGEIPATTSGGAIALTVLLRETKVGIVIWNRETGYDATGEMWVRGIALCARETGDAACAWERKPGEGQWARGVALWERQTDRGVAIRVHESEERSEAALSRFAGTRPRVVALCARRTVSCLALRVHESEGIEGAAVGSVSRYTCARPPSVSRSTCARAAALFASDATDTFISHLYFFLLFARVLAIYLRFLGRGGRALCTLLSVYCCSHIMPAICNRCSVRIQYAHGVKLRGEEMVLTEKRVNWGGGEEEQEKRGGSAGSGEKEKKTRKLISFLLARIHKMRI